MLHEPQGSTGFPNEHVHHTTAIDKDEVLSLTIDLRVLSTEEIYKKYFGPVEK